MDFTALDFETANHRRDSACQLGLAVVRGGKIVDRRVWLIRPEPLSFSSMNIQVHGIRPHQVQNKPTFGELWPEIRPYLVDDCLIAHNASFDMGVLMGCLQSHRCEIPAMHFNCTRLISRATWPGRQGYGLKPLSQWLEIRFQHHDALEDAIACAQILLSAAISLQVPNLTALESRLRLRRGAVGADGYQAAGRATVAKRRSTGSRANSTPNKNLAAANDAWSAELHEVSTDYESSNRDRTSVVSQRIDYQRLCVRAEWIRSLKDQVVVCTGQFSSLTREQLEHLVQRSGGTVVNRVVPGVQWVVVGSPDPRTIESGRSQSVKEQAARQLQAAGHPIQLIGEQELLEMVQRSAGCHAIVNRAQVSG